MIKIFKSFSCAFTGIWAAIKSERNFRIHITFMLIAIAAGIYVELSAVAWGLVIVSIGFVLAAELFNTAIERLGDEAAAGKHNQGVGKVKDLSAAAVLVSALTALAIGIIFLLIPLIQKIFAIIQAR